MMFKVVRDGSRSRDLEGGSNGRWELWVLFLSRCIREGDVDRRNEFFTLDEGFVAMGVRLPNSACYSVCDNVLRQEELGDIYGLE